MEKYGKIKEVLNLLGVVHGNTRENKLDNAKSEIASKARRGIISSYEEYVNDLRKEVEEALDDPNFDWVNVAAETDFVEIIPE